MPECLAVEPDTECLAHRAAGAVTPDEIVGLDALELAALQIDELRRHAGLRRLEGFQPRPVAQADIRECAGEALQDRIEPHLRAYLVLHRAVGLRLLAHPRREHDATELVAGKTRHEGHVAGIVGRERTSVYGVGNAPA